MWLVIPPLLALSWTVEGEQEQATLGAAVASAGDVNGDGFDDVVVGCNCFQAQGSGAALVYLGGAAGLDTVASWTSPSDQFDVDLGASVASAGDVDGDGYDDLLVGAPGYHNEAFSDGKVFLYRGSATGLSETAAWTVEAEQPDESLGSSIASAGDVNGDGYADVVIGAAGYDVNEGRATLYLGSPDGLSATPAWTSEVDVTYTHWGAAVASAGDVDGDGYADVIVGGPGEWFGDEGFAGRVSVFRGGPAGLDDTASWTVVSTDGTSEFGASVASAGDVNGDGFDDIVVGEPRHDGGIVGGRALVYTGSAAGVSVVPSWTAVAGQADAKFGTSVAGAGDVNGDGYDDVVVGAPGHNDGESDEGTATVYLGSASGLAEQATWTAQADVVLASLGTSVASCGDVNGDGFEDVIVGAPVWTNGNNVEGEALVYLGADVGDSDGDGLADDVDVCIGHNDSGDLDGDGFCRLGPDGTTIDCDDERETVFPGAPEACDGWDNGCDGGLDPTDVDNDQDGVFVCAGDCDDTDPEIAPNRAEGCDGVDTTCAGELDPSELDLDADGVLVCAEDCDDADDRVAPSLDEVCGDGLDNDCDQAIDEICGSDAEDTGCGCAGGGTSPAASFGLALAVILLARRRRRSA
jgi:MYXO-CTERM domain-containing protein